MQVSKEELLHIANLSQLIINDDEIDEYMENLQDILNFADIVKNADTNGIETTIGANRIENAFRKDEVVKFEDTDSLLENAPEKLNHMFKVPKVIN